MNKISDGTCFRLWQWPMIVYNYLFLQSCSYKIEITYSWNIDTWVVLIIIYCWYIISNTNKFFNPDGNVELEVNWFS
jgi:hypothetical protein